VAGAPVCAPVGPGQVFPLTDESAAFWFFAPGNLEVVCKVLDGRVLNGRFWLFTAALTSVEFELRVTDSVAGWRKSWFHPASAPSSQSAHPSHFDPTFLQALSLVPDSDREIRLLPRSDFGEDPRYAGLCIDGRPGAARGAPQ